MADIKSNIALCKEVCASPRAQLDKCLASGRKAVGIMPYFCPEELVYAAGMQPFGLWGAEMQIAEAKRYFPAFICSILQTVLELGIAGKLDGLSAIMVPACCDSLKSMDVNWEYGVPSIPVIRCAYAQNRKIPAGVEFTVSQLKKIRNQVADVANREITDAEIAGAVKVYNENRAALRRFVKAAGEHPELVSVSERSAVIKSGYFMDRKEHTAVVNEISDELEKAEKKSWPGLNVVTTGIIADSPELLAIFDENGIAVAADQVAHETGSFICDAPATDDPLVGMAQRLADTEGTSVLFDPGKQRGKQLVELVKASGARAVIWVMTKFCDPEEFDFVPIKRMLDDAGIPVLQIEVDQQMASFGQIKSAVEAFREMLSE